MKTDTSKRILAYVQHHPGITVKEVIAHLKHHPTGVFKHLHTLQQTNHIYKVGGTPKVRYYAYTPMPNSSPALNQFIQWAISGDTQFAAPDTLSPTRDVFQARTERLIHNLQQIEVPDNLAYLLAAAVGEIGNNSFDHNLGRWLDEPGVLFILDTELRTIILADRGQGVLATISRVRPDVTTHSRALEIAFTEIISGRAPEKRGNGLKFVKKVIEENRLHLVYYTGDAMAEIDGNSMKTKKSDVSIPGTLAAITF